MGAAFSRTRANGCRRPQRSLAHARAGADGGGRGVSIIYRRELDAIKDPVEKAKQTKMRIMEMEWGNDMLLREACQDWLDPRDTRPWLIHALSWLENRSEEMEPKKHDNFRI